MKTYRVVLVEDDPEHVQFLLDLIHKTPFLDAVASFTDPLEALPFLSTEPVDLLLLDLYLPHMTGYELLRSLPLLPPVVMVTASLTTSLEAFDLGVIDYLVKPVRYDRFLRAVNRVLNRQPERPPGPAGTRVVTLRQGHESTRVTVDDITYVEAFGAFSKVYLLNQKTLIVSYLLSELLDILPAGQFVRVHRSYIVAVGRVSQFTRRQLLIGTQAIPVGRAYAPQLRTYWPKPG